MKTKIYPKQLLLSLFFLLLAIVYVSALAGCAQLQTKEAKIVGVDGLATKEVPITNVIHFHVSKVANEYSYAFMVETLDDFNLSKFTFTSPSNPEKISYDLPKGSLGWAIVAWQEENGRMQKVLKLEIHAASEADVSRTTLSSISPSLATAQ